MASTFDVKEKLSQLTMPQKIKLLTGWGWWRTESVPEAGIPSMRLSDGPNGVRGSQFFNGVPSNCYPASTGLGSSFDVELAERVGKALGDEAHAKGAHILLAPTVNTQRSPLGGRSFESFSEDPFLNGTIAAAYINGVQSKGITSTIKHFVANDQEFQRFSISSEVSERALREIYLKPFQIAIKNANPRMVMSAYNRINGVHASENKWLLDDVLRKEWGFKGTIISDWIGVYSTAESILAGLDLEMPGPSVMRGKALERALVAEKVFPSDIDARVEKVLELVKHAYNSGLPFNEPEGFLDTPETRQTLRTAAADAIVLLKNDNQLLPLTADKAKKIAVIGPNAKRASPFGGGSASFLPTYVISPLEGITAAAKEIGVEVQYTIGATSHKYLPLLDPCIFTDKDQRGALVEFWNDVPSSDFLSLAPDLNAPLGGIAWSTNTPGTNCFFVDGIDDTKVNLDCHLKYSTKLVPDEDGDWEFGLSIVGKGSLFVDRKLVIDLNTNPPQGDSFFNLGTQEVKATVKGLKAGQAYDVEIRLHNEDPTSRPYLCWGGIRLGGIKKFDAQEAIAEAVRVAQQADATILIVGLGHDWESEGFDRPDLELPGLTNELVSEVLKANTNTIVVNQSGAPVRMPWVNDAKTLLQAFYGGSELGNGLADVIFGKVNPSGKLPLTFPIRLEDCPAFPSYSDKGQEHGKILYNEGIFVGYRGYEIKNIAPLFPFGHGLSYSKFEYSALETTPISPEGKFSVSFKIQNVNGVDGREIAQVYVSDPTSSLPRAIKELKGFVKVFVKAGETRTVTVSLDREALGFYDVRQQHWIAEKGSFGIFVAASSTDIRLRGEVTLEDTFTWVGL